MAKTTFYVLLSLVLLAILGHVVPAGAQFMDRRALSPGQQALEEAMREVDAVEAELADADAAAKAKILKDYAKAMQHPLVKYYMRGGLDLPQPQQQPKK